MHLVLTVASSRYPNWSRSRESDLTRSRLHASDSSLSQIKEDGSVISLGRNRRVQWGSAIRHGEVRPWTSLFPSNLTSSQTDCLENAGRLPPDVYRQSTMFTTLSPCPMCAGAIILYGIKRVVIGENSTFVGKSSGDLPHARLNNDPAGGEDILASRGVEVVNLGK